MRMISQLGHQYRQLIMTQFSYDKHNINKILKYAIKVIICCKSHFPSQLQNSMTNFTKFSTKKKNKKNAYNYMILGTDENNVLFGSQYILETYKREK